MFRRVLPFVLVAAPAVADTPIAEVVCETTPRMLDRLSGAMGATRTAIGLRDEEQLMEVWTDPHGDWTLVASYASGTSCILAMGENWQALPGEDPA